MSRYEAGGRAGLPLSPHLDHGPPSPDQAQFKPKRKLMTKFFNEPVDALDLRLANAEENLSTLPVDPFTDIKQEVSWVNIKYQYKDLLLKKKAQERIKRHLVYFFSVYVTINFRTRSLGWKKEVSQ